MSRQFAFVAALLSLCWMGINSLYAQGVGINSTGALADTSAILDVSSTSKGFLPPRMTATQRAAIPLPATGLVVYQTDGTPGFFYNAGNAASPSWRRLLDSTNATGSQWTTSGSNIYYAPGNVGIHANPTITDGVLDVAGRMRIRSGGDINHSAGLWLNNVANSSLSAFVGMESDTTIGLYGNTGVGWGLGMNTSTGNVSILGKLTFAPSLGKKITLYPGATGDVGFAVQGNLFQMYSDNPGADIAFGYDQAGTMTENMRIKANGNVGIGTSTPDAPLSFPPTLTHKITLYPGATGDAGLGMAPNRLQIYSDNPNADVAIGYDAAGTFNERLAVKPNGAVAVNGNTGAAGQVLQSNGGGSAATWASPTNALFNNVYEFGSISTLLITGNSVTYDVPGLDQNVTFPQTSQVLVSIHVAGVNQGCTLCGDAVAEFFLQIDNGSPFQYKAATVGNGNGFDEDSGFRSLVLSGGPHNFRMTVRHNTGGDINVQDGSPPYGTRMLIIVIPQ